MCELGVFPIFLTERERSFKSGKKSYRWLLLRQEKTLKDSKQRFPINCSWVLSLIDCFQLPFIREEEAVSWTQRFLTRKIWPTNRSLFTKTNLKAIVCRDSTSILQEDDALPRATGPPFLSVLHVKNDTTNIFGYKLSDSTENNKALLFFSGKETIQTFYRSI